MAKKKTTKQRGSNPRSLQNLRKWEPGQSGNPSGRPAVGLARIREFLDAPGKKGSRFDDCLYSVYRKAIAGDIAANKLLFEFALGKPRQIVDINEPVQHS